MGGGGGGVIFFVNCLVRELSKNMMSIFRFGWWQ